MIDLTPGVLPVDGAIKQTGRYCDDCGFTCTVAENGRCAKTDNIYKRIAGAS